jgi:arginine utilization regulatory protein
VRGDLERPPIEVDVRAVCSTELDLRGEVEQGRFHEGLFAQVAAVEIPLPPLRHRRRDIPRLSRHFLAEHARSRGAAITLGRDALDLLQRYDWPGNLDELRAVVEDLAESLPPGAAAGAADLPESIRTRGAPDGVVVPRGTALRDVERTLIEEAMRAAGGNREKAARALGMGVRTLYRKIKAYQEAQPRPGSRRAER